MPTLTKPLLILPPAPQRWLALHDLLGHKGPVWLEDIEQRCTRGVAGAQDAFAVMPSGGQMLASASIQKRLDIGILGHVFTRPDHRRRGFARRLLETAIAWFDMVGGKQLYLGTAAELEPLYAGAGFRVLHHAMRDGQDVLIMTRGAAAPGADDDARDVTIRPAARGDWPLMVALLQEHYGPDPRVSLAESAVAAEPTTLELVSRSEKGVCSLLAAWRGGRIIGLGSIATDELGERTYAMVMPHNDAPPALREALVAEAERKGYKQVEFPLEALAAAVPASWPARPEQPNP